MNKNRHIVLFDGVCNLCNGWVKFIIKKDKKAVFKFASLQSVAGKNLLKEFGPPENNFHSFVYIHNNQHFLKSDAAIEVAKTLGNFQIAATVLKIVPGFIRDGFYNIIAKNRYNWFGKKDACMIPTPELKSRFL